MYKIMLLMPAIFACCKLMVNRSSTRSHDVMHHVVQLLLSGAPSSAVFVQNVHTHLSWCHHYQWIISALSNAKCAYKRLSWFVYTIPHCEDGGMWGGVERGQIVDIVELNCIAIITS